MDVITNLNGRKISSDLVQMSNKHSDTLTQSVFKQYSTSEQWTGKYWIDGKKIYTISFTIEVAANSTNTKALNNLNYHMVWIDNQNSFNTYGGNNTSAPISWINNNFSDYGITYINGNRVMNIKNNSASSRVYYITIRYTKTN